MNVRTSTISTTILLSLTLGALRAQVIPQYQHSSYTGGTYVGGIGVMHVDQSKIQSVLYPTEFPSVPMAVVKNIYLRAYTFPNYTDDPVTYKNVTLKIGYTLDSGWTGTNGYDTFKTGLTTIVNAANFTFKGASVMGAWLKFPVPAGITWVYDPARRFVIEIAHGPEGSNNFGGFDFMMSTQGNMKRTISRDRRDSVWTFNSATNYYLDLGFDFTPVGVAGPGNISSFGLFPNPSTDGHFSISLECKQAMRTVVIKVSNAVGQAVYHAVYENTGNTLFKDVSLQGIPPGIYFAELDIDGEKISRRVTLE